MEKENNKSWKNPNFFEALKHSIDGIFLVIKQERNIKIQLCFALFAVIMGIITKISSIEWLILVITICLVLYAELMNTALENTVDLITEEFNEKAKLAKDISSGAVLICAIMSVIVGIIIFLPKLLVMINILK